MVEEKKFKLEAQIVGFKFDKGDFDTVDMEALGRQTSFSLS